MNILFLICFFICFSSHLYGNLIPADVEQATKSVVKIQHPKGLGTGFFIDQHTLVTAVHVVFNGKNLAPVEKIKIAQIGDTDNSLVTVTGVKDLSFVHDLILLKVTGYKGPFLNFGDFVPGEKVYTVGFPNSELRITVGHKVQNWSTGFELIGHFPEFKGSSGSPVLNVEGKVIGVSQISLENSVDIRKSVYLKNLIEMTSDSQGSYKGYQLILQRIKHIFQLADSGDVHAQLGLGWMYQTGYGVKQNYKKALQYFMLAAKQGHPEAQYKLGEMYFHGFGMRQHNFVEARKWCTLAGEQNYTKALFYLGIIYYGGLGMKQANYEEALRYLKLAAEQNHGLAQSSLGMMYQKRFRSEAT